MSNRPYEYRSILIVLMKSNSMISHILLWALYGYVVNNSLFPNKNNSFNQIIWYCLFIIFANFIRSFPSIGAFWTLEQLFFAPIFTLKSFLFRKSHGFWFVQVSTTERLVLMRSDTYWQCYHSIRFAYLTCVRLGEIAFRIILIVLLVRFIKGAILSVASTSSKRSRNIDKIHFFCSSSHLLTKNRIRHFCFAFHEHLLLSSV